MPKWQKRKNSSAIRWRDCATSKVPGVPGSQENRGHRNSPLTPSSFSLIAWPIPALPASLRDSIERLGNLRLTLFQPFRMATVARGLCIVLVAGHVHRLWQLGGNTDRVRAALIAVGPQMKT